MKANLGFVGDLSESQAKALESFKADVRAFGFEDPPYDDSYLLRFLRARKFDLKNTMAMWINFIKWRKENNVDDIKNFVFAEIEEVKQFYPHGYFKTDKQGRPVYIERLGLLKLQQLFKCTTEDRYIKYFIQQNERLVTEIFPACSKAAGKKIDQRIFIIDIKGGSTKIMSKQVYDFIKTMNSVGSDNYPEILGKMFIVNAPLLFSGIWAMIKPWLDEKTKSKITILGSQYDTQLQEYIDPENLPDFLGGKSTTAEYGEFLNIERGPWVVEEEPETLNKEDEASPRRFEDEKENNDLNNLKSMLAGMNIAGKTKKNNVKKEEEYDDIEGFNAQKL